MFPEMWEYVQSMKERIDSIQVLKRKGKKYKHKQLYSHLITQCYFSDSAVNYTELYKAQIKK